MTAVTIAPTTHAYLRGERHLGFHFCPECGSVAYWRGVTPREDMNPHEEGRRRIVVNLLLAEPDQVAAISVKHFDGLRWAATRTWTAARWRTCGSRK
jgi:hypothetical protein